MLTATGLPDAASVMTLSLFRDSFVSSIAAIVAHRESCGARMEHIILAFFQSCKTQERRPYYGA